MDRAEIERRLGGGASLGFSRPTGDTNYVGWVLLKKVEANERLLEVVAEADAPALVREELRRRTAPYLVLVLELDRRVHESGEYETQADYRQHEKYWFSTLDDVERQLSAWGYALAEVQDARALDAP